MLRCVVASTGIYLASPGEGTQPRARRTGGHLNPSRATERPWRRSWTRPLVRSTSHEVLDLAAVRSRPEGGDCAGKALITEPVASLAFFDPIGVSPF
jgi:hypothetical protein